MKRYLGCLALVLGACSSTPLDLGSQEGGAPVVGKPGPTSESCENGPQLPIVGTWLGYIENYPFISGSDAVRIHITHANDSLICGTVVLGNPAAPPPVNDPHIAYPPGRFDPPHLVNGWDSTGALLVYAEGFVLPIEGAKVTGSRAQFAANWVRPWQPWCEQQVPVETPGLGYQCTSADDPACSGGQHCGKTVLCSGICSCTAATCTASGHPDRPLCQFVNFDMQLGGPSLDGSIKLACGGVNNVHLERAP